MDSATYQFESKVWLYDGFGGWHFVHVPKTESEEIKDRFGTTKKRGWGSIPVTVTIGATTWKTSIFPSKEAGYLLALKSEVRQEEKIADGDTVSVRLHIQGI